MAATKARIQAERELLNAARQEIAQLRYANEILGAKVETMDLFRMALCASTERRGEGFGEDVHWQLTKRLDELDEEERKLPQATAGSADL